MSLRRISIDGDGFDAGMALGRVTRPAIHEALPRVPEFRDLQRWCGSPRLADLRQAAEAAFPLYVRELEGLAAGAECDFEQLLAWNCRGELRLRSGLPSGNEGCTTVLMAAGPSRPAIIGHNEDGEPHLDGWCVLVDARSRRGPGFTAFCYPGLLPGNAFGVNGHGLVQTINNIAPHGLAAGLPRQFISRAILDCSDLESALALLRRLDRGGGFHHCLAQAGDPRLLAVEAPPEGCNVKLVSDIYAHANHLIEESFSGASQTITPSSAARQARADALLEQIRVDWNRRKAIHRPGESALIVKFRADSRDCAEPHGGSNQSRSALGDDALARRNARSAEALLFDRHDEVFPIYRNKIGGEDSGYTLATAVFEIHEDRVDWRVVTAPGQPPSHSGRVSRA